ncbi:MAG: adenylyltransferase/cytidyltransferase family protein [Patescibacteria group bacterium]
MSVITPADFPEIRKKHKNKIIVYCDGSFDLPHAGHVLHLEDCKRRGDYLVVGVGSDKDHKRYKGNERPILNESVRIKIIDSFKPVNYCFINRLPETGSNLLPHLDGFLSSLKPDIYAINEDAFDIPYRKKVAKKHGVKLVILKRSSPPEFDNISTSRIIEKIKKAK